MCGGGTAELINIDGVDHYRCRNQAQCKEFICRATPLVLVFNTATPVTYQADNGQGLFDLSAAQDGSARRTDWPTASTPWLALDEDGDGQITSGRELFGSATLLGSTTAAHGFEALSMLDNNGDAIIDARDPGFSRLRLWYDQNSDRVSSSDELKTLSEMGIISLELSYRAEPRCDSRGNCERERARFCWRDSQGQLRVGAIVDVYLAIHSGAAPGLVHSSSPSTFLPVIEPVCSAKNHP
jgi:hypothetical protein